MHSHSYISSDCASKLFPLMFHDSSIAKKYHCGRTKLSALVSNVLGNESIRIVLKELENNVPFSISTDASNKGSTKTFPIVLRYFTKDKGMQTKLLSFYSLESEDSYTIANSLKTNLEKNNLDMSNVTSFCADNASVNFGKNKSVFVELKKVNPLLVPVGCNNHILHNTAKKATSTLRIDIESVVIKIYNEFSNSTKRVAILKDFFEWLDIEWSNNLQQIPTRWLSLVPALERLIKNYEPIKSYFLSHKSSAIFITNFFNDDLAMAYLGFVFNTCSVFQPAMIKLQGNNVIITEVYDIMDSIRNSMIERKRQKFYGSIADGEISNCVNDDLIRQFQKDADKFLEIAINYLQKWFDYENNKLKILKCLDMNTEIQFSSLSKIISEFAIKDIDIDILFEESIRLNNFIQNKDNKIKSISENWTEFFQSSTHANINILKIVSFVFSIPHTNATSERIFSLMANAWRKERNRLLMDTLSCELKIKQNFGMTCSQFANFLKSDDGKKLLKKIKTVEKYNK